MPGPFPQRFLSDEDIETARFYDQKNKAERESIINSSKYKKPSEMQVGDEVLIRNHNKSSKFNLFFFCLIRSSSEMLLIMVENCR